MALRTSAGNSWDLPLTRRDLLRRAGGLGSLALAFLLGNDGRLVGQEGRRVFPLRTRGAVRSVILLYMGGGPSHVDTWDCKAELQKRGGQDLPESIAKALPTQTRLRVKNLYPSPYGSQPFGQSRLVVSDLFRQTAEHADAICVVRSLRHTSVVHTPAEYLTLTGSFTGTRPSLGSWFYYGLGSENDNLPGFIVMIAGDNFGGPAGYSAGFLPARFQGTLVKGAEGIANIRMPAGVERSQRRAQLDLLRKFNDRHLTDAGAVQSELEARIHSYEMAFRMQSAAPEAFDLSAEPEETRALYGIDRKETAEYGSNCLLARRLIERGVRFVQLNQGGWDAHGDLKGNHEKQAAKVDRPIAGLLADLKRRHLLAQTLVVWGGEFGRTPTAEGDAKTPGRDHSPTAYSMWLAGGGVKGGQVIGATDDFGYTVVDRPVHPNDLQATLLHALGVDQHELYYEHHNRRELVTFNGGEVIKEVFG